MKVVDDVRTCEESYPDVVLTIGSFDGIHRGHQLILNSVVSEAKARGGTAALLTMRPHPRQYFSQKHAPNLLTSEKKKFELLDDLGIDVTFVLPFNEETSTMSPETFVEEIVQRRCGAKKVIVGHDCRFGHKAQGDFALLQAMGPELGFETEQIPALLIDAERVSSTLIRERVLQGELDTVEELLGRKYSITGRVVQGRGIGGSKLGYPTANIKPDHRAVPAQGVYAAVAYFREMRKTAAVNIGIAPTIRHEDTTIEAHILEFDGHLRGEEIEIEFHKRLRPERKFPSYEALVEQIDRDVEEVRAYFARVDND